MDKIMLSLESHFLVLVTASVSTEVGAHKFLSVGVFMKASVLPTLSQKKVSTVFSYDGIDAKICNQK